MAVFGLQGTASAYISSGGSENRCGGSMEDYYGHHGKGRTFEGTVNGEKVKFKAKIRFYPDGQVKVIGAREDGSTREGVGQWSLAVIDGYGRVGSSIASNEIGFNLNPQCRSNKNEGRATVPDVLTGTVWFSNQDNDSQVRLVAVRD
ncbi:hypothetical protein ACGFYF_42375 [Streptomyces lavendulae]|uniref:hypothetical protein n=1 Tax=Streptomyces lavendulae TaxID=1914 RepID=UPI003718EFB0